MESFTHRGACTDEGYLILSILDLTVFFSLVCLLLFFLVAWAHGPKPQCIKCHAAPSTNIRQQRKKGFLLHSTILNVILH